MSDLDDAEDDGGFDPEAFARRQAHLVESPRVKIKLEPPEPQEAVAWVEAKDAPIIVAFRKRLADLGKKPKATSGPMSIGARAKLAEWEHGWSAARLELTTAQSAIFNGVPDALLRLEGARYHLQLRADRRQAIVRQDEAHLAMRQRELKDAREALKEADAPARAGRELALANIKVAFGKLLTELRKEEERHKKHAKDAGEEERHEQALKHIEARTKALLVQKGYLEARLKLDYAGQPRE